MHGNGPVPRRGGTVRVDLRARRDTGQQAASFCSGIRPVISDGDLRVAHRPPAGPRSVGSTSVRRRPPAARRRAGRQRPLLSRGGLQAQRFSICIIAPDIGDRKTNPDSVDVRTKVINNACTALRWRCFCKESTIILQWFYPFYCFVPEE